MCGIVGITGKSNAVEILINGLEKLEYRGYDSAGIYLNNGNGNDFLVKVKGRIADLKDKVTDDVKGTAGIGHTRLGYTRNSERNECASARFGKWPLLSRSQRRHRQF